MMASGKYSNTMRGAYWYAQCKPYFKWGYDPCKNRDCYNECVVMCERSYEFKRPGFVLHFHGCNLNCKFCWAHGMREKSFMTKDPEEVIEQLLCKLKQLHGDDFIGRSRIKPSMISSIRVTGNEPILQWDHLIELLRMLDNMDGILSRATEITDNGEEALYYSTLLHGMEVLIQTNGIDVGKLDSSINPADLEVLSGISVIVEVSFKGVNKEQFSWLTDSPGNLFENQCLGFEKLRSIKSGMVTVLPELGVCHCETVKKYQDLGVRIINREGEPLDFTDYDDIFKDKVLKYSDLELEPNEFQEFGEIQKERARQVVETFSKSTGLTIKNCLPSEFSGRSKSSQSYDSTRSPV